MNKKFGIIIPTYDNLEMLKRLIGQIYDFTLIDFKLIIIEDGQREDTLIYLRELVKEKPNIVVIVHPQNKGVAPSWNDGIREAEKYNVEYFAFFNDDIEIYKNWWEEVQQKFEQGYNLVSTCKPCYGHKIMAGWFFVFDKETLKRVGYFDEQLSPFYQEDTDFIWRFIRTNLKSVLLDNPQLKHYTSTTVEKNIRVNQPEFYQRTIEKVNKYLTEKWRGLER